MPLHGLGTLALLWPTHFMPDFPGLPNFWPEITFSSLLFRSSGKAEPWTFCSDGGVFQEPHMPRALSASQIWLKFYMAQLPQCFLLLGLLDSEA